MCDEMDSILSKLGLGICSAAFRTEKISPDIVCKLSMHEMRFLGVNDSSDMMKLRVECIKYGPVINDNRNEPAYNISKNILEALIESGFKIREMSKLLSVSERTIYRRMSKYDLSVYNFTSIDDDTLQREVVQVTQEFPRVGETLIRQILHQKGIKITRWQLRDILHRTDQVGIEERLRRRLHRRVYNVDAPNHLWHLDTNHKLIRWNFIICGGIDGFSRFIVFLKCENNNKAETILKCFLDGTEKYGYPLRVRSDQGLENIRVAEHMIRSRGLNRRSMISGKSTHNQRIERLWRDVYEGVLCFYYDLFHFMEDHGILDPLNEMHIYALHYVFIGKINQKLDIWRHAWARHRLRTARSSPLRLFMSGSINCPVDTPLTDTEAIFYGVEGDIEADVNQTDGQQRPSVNPIGLEVSPECERNLVLNCPLAWVSNNYGIDIYLKAVDILQTYVIF